MSDLHPAVANDMIVPGTRTGSSTVPSAGLRQAIRRRSPAVNTSHLPEGDQAIEL